MAFRRSVSPRASRSSTPMSSKDRRSWPGSVSQLVCPGLVVTSERGAAGVLPVCGPLNPSYRRDATIAGVALTFKLFKQRQPFENGVVVANREFKPLPGSAHQRHVPRAASWVTGGRSRLLS